MGKKNGKRLRIQAARALEFPPETIVAGVSLKLFDNTGCTVEGPYHIGTYSQTNLELKTKFGSVYFTGRDIAIEYMAQNILSFSGEIQKIEYRGFPIP